MYQSQRVWESIVQSRTPLFLLLRHLLTSLQQGSFLHTPLFELVFDCGIENDTHDISRTNESLDFSAESLIDKVPNHPAY